MASNLDLVNDCDNFPYHQDNPTLYTELPSYFAFKVAGCDSALGYIPEFVVRKMFWPAHEWRVDDASRTVELLKGVEEANYLQRTNIVTSLLSHAVISDDFEVLRGWRNERYPVYGPGKEVLFSMERAAAALFGIVTYGVHMTAYVETEEGMKIWVPRRAKTKQTFPGMLDNTVAGGIATGEKPFDCLVREAMEEASLPEEVVKADAKACGAITYFYVRDERAGGETGLLQPEVEYIYDLKLDPSIIPKPGDNEVESFELWAIDELKEALARREFKPNCAMVLIDFFIRHGILTPENEPDYLIILARLHRLFEFPTA